MTAFYGLKTCDTCRKARRWLDANGLDYRYHDVREDGLDRALLERWLQRVDWPLLVNRRSKTWRDIPDGERTGLDREGAVSLLSRHPTLLKRPVLEAGDTLMVGFDERRYRELANRS